MQPRWALTSRTRARLAAALFVVAGAAACGGDAPSPDSIERTPAYQDRLALERAWHLPEASRYRAAFVAQQHFYDCGPMTLVDVERSIGATDMTEDAALHRAGLHAWNVLGMNLDALADFGRALGLHVTVIRDMSLEDFRDELRKSNDPSLRYTVNFTRAPLFGRGGGHHSPIGGYLESEDLVLVLDVNDRYHPWLVSSERLFRAVDTVDSDGKKKRGLLRIEAAAGN